jgi:hypothetical protein
MDSNSKVERHDEVVCVCDQLENCNLILQKFLRSKMSVTRVGVLVGGGLLKEKL